jgi:ABC-type amino acid transport substrate-binding protein
MPAGRDHSQAGAIELECGSSILAAASSGIRGGKDLNGKRVGLIPGTTTEKNLATAPAALSVKAQIVNVTEDREGLQGLEAGRLEAYASDHLLLAVYRSGVIVEIYERWFGSFNDVAPLMRSLPPAQLARLVDQSRADAGRLTGGTA